MPCSDSSSGLNIFIDHDDKILNFQFAKATCSSEITSGKSFKEFCKGKTLLDILDAEFDMIVSYLDINRDDEAKFMLYLEWDALRSGIAQYLGVDRSDLDVERCMISSIEESAHGHEISFIILPPKELPKITSCGQKVAQQFDS